jgi:phenylacetate-CoA ligase
MNIFNFLLNLSGYKIYRAKKKLIDIKLLNNDLLIEFKERKKWEIFNFHLENNSMYSEFIGSKSIENWSEVPIMSKSDLQLPLDKLLSKDYNKKNIYTHNTSGSSGHPFRFAKDKFCHALCWAMIQDRFSWHGINNGKDLQARFYGIPKSYFFLLIERIKDYILNRFRFDVFDLSEKSLENIVSKFQTKPFVYVNGYTNTLVLLSNYCIEKNIILKKICPSLKVVFVTSEVCDKIDRERIKSAFGVNVVNEYGASELDLISFDDIDGDCLVNHETLHVEFLDDNNCPVTSGNEGRVVVTSLFNKAMPFIRYDLGDKAILNKKTKRSYKTLKKIIGRQNDNIYLPSGKITVGLTFYYVSKRILEKSGLLKEFIVKQKKINHFHFEYIANRELNKSEKQLIQKCMDEYLEPNLTISYQRTNFIKRTKAGKLMNFISELK